MKVITKFFIFSFVILFSGCLVFNKVTYNIKLSENGKGKTEIYFYDIRSNAASASELETDKSNLFDYILKGKELTDEFKAHNKTILKKELFKQGDALNGRIIYTFDSLDYVDQVRFESGFYVLNLEPGDSVVSTNGQIMDLQDKRRIIWNPGTKEIKFVLLTNNFFEKPFTKLAPYYKQ